jgi:hypothetical protein
MSKIFYDRLIVLEEVEAEIKKAAQTQEEKEELWGLIDEIIHHRVMGTLLDRLPRDNHEDFLVRFHKAPHDDSLMDYLSQQIGENVEELIRREIGELAYELIKEIRKE